jgi:hypothetical protein
MFFEDRLSGLRGFGCIVKCVERQQHLGDTQTAIGRQLFASKFCNAIARSVVAGEGSVVVTAKEM